MNVTVCGYGHFATTVATALTLRGHAVVQFDFDPPLLRAGQELEKEPNWPNVTVPRGAQAIAAWTADLVWMAYDTPLLVNGRGDINRVAARIAMACSDLPHGQAVLLSSQWPVGTTEVLVRNYPWLKFGYAVENIRVGHALADFMEQSTLIVGTTDRSAFESLESLWSVIWMSIESAEMSKHALNGLLALQIAYANEIDALARRHGADGEDIHRALLTDRRVSPFAPLKPGGPFGGGSLQRDVITLNELAARHHLELPIISAIIPSNDGHRP